MTPDEYAALIKAEGFVDATTQAVESLLAAQPKRVDAVVNAPPAVANAAPNPPKSKKGK